MLADAGETSAVSTTNHPLTGGSDSFDEASCHRETDHDVTRSLPPGGDTTGCARTSRTLCEGYVQFETSAGLPIHYRCRYEHRLRSFSISAVLAASATR
jgi:hypothetical protein